jgi:cytochrome P450
MIRIGPLTALVVTSAAVMQELFVERPSDFRKSRRFVRALAPALGNGLLTSEDPLHRRQRKLMAPVFTPGQVAVYADTIVGWVDRTERRWDDGARIDLTTEMTELALSIISEVLFGAELTSDAVDFVQALLVLNRLATEDYTRVIRTPRFVPTPRNRRSARALRHIDSTIGRVIERRGTRPEPRDDLLSRLLSARADDTAMTDRQVRDEVMTLVVAGHETTALALTWTFYLIGRHARVRGLLQAEVEQTLGNRPPTADDLPRLSYTSAVLKESLRLYPPVYIRGREAARNTTLGGYEIPKGQHVLINNWGLHRQARAFPEPDAFIPERWLDGLEQRLERCQYLPFGDGPRVCIGSHLAVMEMQVVLARLTQCVEFELADVAPCEPAPLVTLKPKGAIPVVVRRRWARKNVYDPSLEAMAQEFGVPK